jgi:hypothetical protein
MTAAKKPAVQEHQPSLEFSWSEVVPVLLRSRGVDSGLWKFGIRLRFAAINTVQQPDSNGAIPAGVVGIDSISITPASEPGQLVFDAATGKEAIGKKAPARLPPSSATTKRTKLK